MRSSAANQASAFLNIVGRMCVLLVSVGSICALSACKDAKQPTPANNTAAPTTFGSATSQGLPSSNGPATLSGFTPYPEYVALSSGNGFKPMTVWGSAIAAYPRSLGDLNGDGKADLVTGANPTPTPPGQNYVAQLSTGSSFGPLQSWIHFGPPNEANWIIFDLADSDGDKKADAFITTPQNGFSLAKSTGQGFGNPTQLPFQRGSSTLCWFADVNGDGKADFIEYDRNTGSVEVALSNGTTFGPLTQWMSTSIPNAWTFYVADMDGDGKNDLILVPQTGPGLYVAYSTGTGFSRLWNWKYPEPVSGPNIVGFADVNGDHRADIVIGQPGGGVHIGINSGVDFTVLPQWNLVMPKAVYFNLADFDGDGKADVLFFVVP